MRVLYFWLWYFKLVVLMNSIYNQIVVFISITVPSTHGPQSQITIDTPDFHPERSQKCVLGNTMNWKYNRWLPISIGIFKRDEIQSISTFVWQGFNALMSAKFEWVRKSKENNHWTFFWHLYPSSSFAGFVRTPQWQKSSLYLNIKWST